MNEGRLPSRKVPFAYLWSNSTRAASGCEAAWAAIAGRSLRQANGVSYPRTILPPWGEWAPVGGGAFPP